MALDARFNPATGQIEDSSRFEIGKYSSGSCLYSSSSVFEAPDSDGDVLICIDTGDDRGVNTYVSFEAILQYALAHASRSTIFERLRQMRNEQEEELPEIALDDDGELNG